MIEWSTAQHLYLSPHLDDAVLSCGGLIAQQARRGEKVAIITVFAASPEAETPLSPFAKLLHAFWQASAPPGQDFSDPPAARRAEDRRACAALSPDIAVVHLSLMDCIYRCEPATGQPLYASREAIFGAVHPADPAPATLAGWPLPPARTTLYVPLEVGHHVDHQVVRGAVEGWGLAAEQVRYYEDYPYVEQPGALESALGRESNWEPLSIPLDEEALQAKIRAVAEYASQIGTFWADVEAMAAALRRYAEQVGGERFWLRRG